MFSRFTAWIWHGLRGSLQWRVLWMSHAKFVVGVTGIVRDEQQHVLLLRHRMWSKRRPWGLPTGFAVKGEEFGDTVVREVREETGLDVAVGRLVRLNSGFKLRAEVTYEARLTGGTLRIDPFEILEARWFAVDELPDGLLDAHRRLILETTVGLSQTAER
ncbi:NUDIX domain-containing protein [Streptomyces sp. NPDC016845]|uniref:NUDIX domain-containing protein n=1 Tax=Streptomyces sp. NPDC016845 TaxID=3364972 RepID=UPI0037B9D446